MITLYSVIHVLILHNLSIYENSFVLNLALIHDSSLIHNQSQPYATRTAHIILVNRLHFLVQQQKLHVVLVGNVPLLVLPGSTTRKYDIRPHSIFTFQLNPSTSSNFYNRFLKLRRSIEHIFTIETTWRYAEL